MRMRNHATIRDTTGDNAVALAVQDLARDIGWITGEPAEVTNAEGAMIEVAVAPAIGTCEAWHVSVNDDCVRIVGSDALGAVYGVYAFSQRWLNVDPLWFWKDVFPARQRELVLPNGEAESKPSTFSYRGWFVNDEDLLTEWLPPSGPRYIDYRFYHQVINVSIAEAIYEAILRCGGNLVIPASFVDVMNPPEAELVRRAAQRGLYVSQHHIEPLGVSHFGFENYWKSRGQEVAFAYGSEPERLRETWRAYAQRWCELAPGRVVWQVGLRGKGDRPIWHHDASVAEDDAGRFISRAMEDQWEIVCAVDDRTQPPATTTLWAEGSRLMASGALKIPPQVAIIFSDNHWQLMQRDFHETRREPDRRYGVYYHIAVWGNGPHLMQGTRLERLEEQMRSIVARGDTHYAIINVCNIREHVLGIGSAMGLMNDCEAWSREDFMARFAPSALRPLYEFFQQSIYEDGERLLQDGSCWGAILRAIAALEQGERLGPESWWPRREHDPATDTPELLDVADRLKDLAESFTTVAEHPAIEHVAPAERAFFRVNLQVQAAMMAGMYRCLSHLLLAQTEGETCLAEAKAALQDVLEVRREAEEGKWKNWYRGDRKENLVAGMERLGALASQLQADLGDCSVSPNIERN